jgi:O-antigen/teichoic acid export membrane protein
MTILSILVMVGSLGMSTAILRYSAQYALSEKVGSIRYVYKIMLSMAVPFSLLLSVLLYCMRIILSEKVFHDSSLTLAFVIVAIIIPFSVINIINAEAIRGQKKIKEAEVFRYIGPSCLNTILLICMIVPLFVGSAEGDAGIAARPMWFSFFPTSMTAVFTYSVSIVIICNASFFFFVKTINKNSGTFVDKAQLKPKRILDVSLPMLMTASFYLIMGHTDKIMIGIYRTTAEVGIYDVALKLATITSFTLAAINAIVAPKFAELHYQSKMEELKHVVRFSSKLIFWTSAPILIAYLIFPDFFMSIFGKGFIAGKRALILLAIGQFINAISGSVGFFLNMTGRQAILRNIIFVAAIINIVLNIALVPPLGITGAAIATTVSMGFWNLVALGYVFFKFRIRIGYLPLVG